MPSVPSRFPIVAALLILAAPAFAQTSTETSVAVTPVASPALEVRRLAPQLIGFAGTDMNFQSLVNGLALGTPVTLVTVTPGGLLQTATFTPSSGLSTLEIARTLEMARQNLIARGIGAPSGEQIGITLLGGSLATPAGSVPVAGLLPRAPAAQAGTPAASASASAGSSSAVAPDANGLTVSTQQIPQGTAVAVPGGVVAPPATSTSPRRNTSDSPFTSHTSDTPAPGAAGPNGPPSPAMQLQNRR